MMRMKDENIVLSGKIFAILFPCPIVSTMRTQLITRDPAVQLIWTNLICKSVIV